MLREHTSIFTIAIGTVMFSMANVQATSAALVAFYPFEGDATDASGNGFDGTLLPLADPPTLTPSYNAQEGQAFLFDDVHSIRIELDISPSVYPKLTIGAWARRDTVFFGERVIASSGGRAIGTQTDSWAVGVGAGNDTEKGEPFTEGVWAFIAAVYDHTAQTVTFYNNNSVVTFDTNVVDGFAFTTIGGPATADGTFGHEGAIDNVFIYDEALSPEEIAAIRIGGSAAIVPEPSTLAMFATGALCLGLMFRRCSR